MTGGRFELASSLRHRAAAHPERVCLERGSERWTNAEFLRACVTLGDHLMQGDGPRAVAVSAGSSRYVPFLVGASVLARFDLLLMTSYPSLEALGRVTGPLGLRHVLHDRPEEAEGFARLDDVAEVWRQGTGAGAGVPSDAGLPQADDDHCAAFIFQTSGTTGEPKLVRCEHRAFATVIQSMQTGAALDHADGVRVFLSQPLVHSYGLSSYLEYLSAGATIVLPAEQSPLGPIGDLAASASDVEAVEGVPHFWMQFSRLSGRLRLPSLRHVGIGGGALDATVMRVVLDRTPHATMSVRYGLTETPSVVTHKVFRPPHNGSGWHSSGRVMTAYGLDVRDERGALVPDGQEGEIVVTGSCVSAADGVLLTGDLGYRDAHGELVVTGRRSTFIKRRGYRVSPDVVEAAARECEGVADCRATERDEQLVLEVVYTSADAAQVLMTGLRARLPEAMVPDVLVPVDAIPRTFSGKIRRQ